MKYKNSGQQKKNILMGLKDSHLKLNVQYFSYLVYPHDQNKITNIKSYSLHHFCYKKLINAYMFSTSASEIQMVYISMLLSKLSKSNTDRKNNY